MKTKTLSWFVAVKAAVFFVCATAYAVNVNTYNDFQRELLAGNDVELNRSDIIKANGNLRTIDITKSLTISGGGRVIELNALGNMLTVSTENITVNLISATVRNGNYELNGGAVTLTGNGSGLNVGGASAFKDSLSSQSGGAIYASGGAGLVFTGTVTFQNNSAGKSGGALSLAYGASSDFSGAVLNASNNRSSLGNGGFLSALEAGNITFGEAVFSNNSALSPLSAVGSGGVIFSSGSANIRFTGDASFIDNSAYAAGAVYLTNASAAFFSGSKTVFEGNQSFDEAAALIVRRGAKVYFNGADTIFKNNFMTNNNYGTGAVDIAYNSYADFSGTKLTAQGNNAGTGGWGGFMWSDSSTVLFGSAFIGGAGAGEGNRAYFGGGIYAGNNDIVTFSGPEAVFRNNKASVDGGALYVTTSSFVNFNASVSNAAFMGNTASGSGGAAALKNESSLIMNGAGIYFDGNSAAFGGAVSVEGGSTFEVKNGNFINNSASTAGGAVYLKGTSYGRRSVLRSNTGQEGGGKTVFRGNFARGISNALYLDDFSSAYFNIAAGASVEMEDGVSGKSADSAYFEVSGAGDFNLGGAFDVLDLNLYGRFNMLPGSKMNAGEINIFNGARFSTQNGAADTAYAAALANSGTVAMDVLQDSNDIIAVSGNLALDSASLEVEAAHITDADFRKKIYKLINYGAYSGSFAAVNIISPAAVSSYHVDYGDIYDGWITLALLGNKAVTDFGGISGAGFNQKETGKALDKISAGAAAYGPWDLALAELETYGEEGVKNALTGISGYFLPNIIRNAAADSPNNEIYDRIKNHCRERDVLSCDFWIQAKGGVESFYGNENSPEDYKDFSSGFMAGYDRYMDDINLMLGVYGRISRDSIEQGRHEADGKKTGFGIYGGYVKKSWELKALTLASFNSFDVKRYVPLAAATAESEIKTTSLSFDFEGALKFDMGFNTKFRPYGGVEFVNAGYKAFGESGAGIYNLDVGGGNYLRTSGRAGAGLHYEEDIWDVYANLEGKYLLNGAEPEIENAFDGSGVSFKTRGSREGRLQIGAAAGAALKMTKALKLFANANFYAADKYSNIYGNIGLRYTFCNPLYLKREKTAPDYDRQPSREPVGILPDSEMPAVYYEETGEAEFDDESSFERQMEEAEQRRSKPVLKSYSLNMASFDAGKAALKDAAKKSIEKEAREIKSFDYKRIIIEGHTDSTGSGALNKELSRESQSRI